MSLGSSVGSWALSSPWGRTVGRRVQTGLEAETTDRVLCWGQAPFQRPGGPGLLCRPSREGRGGCPPAGSRLEPRALRASPLKAPRKEVNFEDVRVWVLFFNQLATLWAPLCLALRLSQAGSAPHSPPRIRKTTSARARKRRALMGSVHWLLLAFLPLNSWEAAATGGLGGCATIVFLCLL